MWWQLPVAIVLWLIFFEWPHPPGASLDSSWQHALADAWIHRRAFGSDIDFTYGPWGFLLSPESVPASFWVHLAFQLVAKFVFAIALVEFSTRLRVAARVMFLVAFAVLAGLTTIRLGEGLHGRRASARETLLALGPRQAVAAR